ncbi:MAG: MaoC family dehydratase [Acidaminococcaceae bacterium]|nr:MaoC family dehydratase [Acidaminococcaceae bacterium]MBO6038686.1 MaoC family dehydratase [Acidaminococcaceae bacterium]MBP5736092.1 MaoC family dehydratase [Acidaminococcaceae bacterium]
MKFAEVQVGVPYPEKQFKITKEAVEAYLAAVEDAAPLYAEEQLVPPAYAAVYTRWEALTGEQLEDGTVHAKQVFRYLRPVHWGETLTLRGQVKEKMEKRGLKFVVQKVEALNGAGELAVESEITIILPA